MPAPSRPPVPLLPRLCALVLLVCGLALVYSTLRTAYVDYQFHTLDPKQSDNQVATRVEYAQSLRRLLAINPANSEIRSRLANVLAGLGDYPNASAELERALLTQRAQNSLELLAQVEERLGRPDEAIKAMSKSVIMNPFSIEPNRALLRLLNSRLDRLKVTKPRTAEVNAALAQSRRDFALHATNWFIRAYADSNAYLFMGNNFIEPLAPLQAYRTYLAGLAMIETGGEGSAQLMIDPKNVNVTIRQILNGRYARPYRELP